MIPLGYSDFAGVTVVETAILPEQLEKAEYSVICLNHMKAI